MAVLLVIILGAVCAVVVGLLLWPLRYRVEGVYRDGWRYSISLRFAALSFTRERTVQGVDQRFALLGYKAAPKAKRKQTAKQSPEREADRDSQPERKTDSFVSLRGFGVEDLRLVLRLVVELLETLKPRVWHADLLVGFIEPEYNGVLLAVYHTWKGLDPRLPCRLAADWQREVVEFSGAAAGRVSLGSLAARVCKHLLSRRGRRLVVRLIRERRQRSERYA